jgi:hypothetical protein
MTFDFPFDQPLDVRSHGYINSNRENSHGNSLVTCESHVYLDPVTSLGTQHGGKPKDIRCNKKIINLCRIIDVIKQLASSRVT